MHTNKERNYAGKRVRDPYAPNTPRRKVSIECTKDHTTHSNRFSSSVEECGSGKGRTASSKNVPFGYAPEGRTAHVESLEDAAERVSSTELCEQSSSERSNDFQAG
mmetsp:Transcript_21719/g.41598  ORF Transcript_21719/g.41598 Transcript_21719/m.41598 type:complete len:106 (+) Transcript_21719:1557-1874(+)